MKRTLLLITLLFLYSSGSKAQNFWDHVITPDSIGFINDISCDTTGIIYLACSEYWLGKGGVYRSEDDGTSWQHFRHGLSYADIRSLAIDGNNNLFIGATDKLYKSTDHAESWQQIFSLNNHFISVIKCGYDSIILIGCTDQAGINRSGDHGITWQNVLSLNPIGYNEYISDICFGPNEIIYACTTTQYAGIGNIYKSTDLGLTWETFPLEGYYSTLGFDNAGRLIAGTYGEGIYRYDFETAIWEHVLIGGTPNDILVVPDNRVFLSWSYGRVLESDDGGDTYHSISTGISETNDMMNFAIDYSGKIYIHGGGLYRSNDIIFTDIKMNISNNTGTLNCFPNPCREYTNFYSNTVKKQSEEGELSIYNSRGELIFQCKIKTGQPFQWDTADLPAGIYLARLCDQESVSIVKLLHQ